MYVPKYMLSIVIVAVIVVVVGLGFWWIEKKTKNYDTVDTVGYMWNVLSVVGGIGCVILLFLAINSHL